jgi:hypothetical protein
MMTFFTFLHQAHDVSVRAMRWSHNDQWMVTADHAGYVKYWQSNMNNVKMYQGHKEPIRGVRLATTVLSIHVIMAVAVTTPFVAIAAPERQVASCVVGCDVCKYALFVWARRERNKDCSIFTNLMGFYKWVGCLFYLLIFISSVKLKILCVKIQNIKDSRRISFLCSFIVLFELFILYWVAGEDVYFFQYNLNSNDVENIGVENWVYVYSAHSTFAFCMNKELKLPTDEI